MLLRQGSGVGFRGKVGFGCPKTQLPAVLCQVEQYCFRAPYIAALLRRGLRVDEAHIRIGSGDVAWTLGAGHAQKPASIVWLTSWPELVLGLWLQDVT